MPDSVYHETEECGGAISLDNVDDATLKNVIFSNNFAYQDGGTVVRVRASFVNVWIRNRVGFVSAGVRVRVRVSFVSIGIRVRASFVNVWIRNRVGFVRKYNIFKGGIIYVIKRNCPSTLFGFMVYTVWHSCS